MAKVGRKAALGAATLALAAVLIPRWESGGRMSLVVTQQSIDRKGVYTVCDGVTNLDADYAWIRPGMTFTEHQCAEAFRKILPKYADPIATCIPTYNTMPPHRQTALLSFAYNVGPSAICTGSVAREFNRGNVKAGCEAMGRYTRANGRTLRGLENRRFDPKWGEIAWCLRDD